ncbi:porin [Cellvibrio sp. KY-YJ-3]|uniref:porin n=1 Tax=Cellvibrio sp. KY-YJ-3 TaxID=454662 RepID=UPI0012478C1E|nr:porin [Cellvibrio sp. KY-YJ-3]QEY11917.1 porin [Cellvibrio sp. KY-YJ-3]
MSFQKSWSVARSLVSKKAFQRNLLTTAVGIALSANAFAGFPTLYGKVYLTAGQYDLEKNDFSLTAPGATTYRHIGATGIATELDTFVLESTGSRLGVQGDFDANAEVQVFYRVEYGIDVDNGTNSNGRELTQRNIFAGIRGDWGSLLAGKNDTPLKTLQTNSVLRSDIDRFNDAPLADIGSYLVGENRPDNVIQYASPILLGGLEVNIAAIQAEETGVEVSPTNAQDDNGFASGQSVSVVYGKSKWFVGAAFDRNVVTSDVFRALGEVSLGPVKLAAIYQTAERHEDVDLLGGFSTFVGTNGTNLGAQNGLNPLSEWDGATGNAYKEQDGYVLNALWKIAGPWSARVQYGHSTSTPTNDSYSDVDADALAVGVDYNFNSATRVFGYYASLEAEGDAQISTKATTDSTFALGLDFRF